MAATELKLKIVSAEKTIFDSTVTTVTLPGTSGKFSVLPDHAPLISSLNAGVITYNSRGSVQTVEIKGGFIEVKQNVVTVCIE